LASDSRPESRSSEYGSMTDKIGDRRVDHFVSKVFELRDVTGKERYPALKKVDMEQGLSETIKLCQRIELRRRLITSSVLLRHHLL